MVADVGRQGFRNDSIRESRSCYRITVGPCWHRRIICEMIEPVAMS